MQLTASLPLLLLAAFSCVSPTQIANRLPCETNADCEVDRSCADSQCVNSCEGACGANSICVVTNHTHVCFCEPGYMGNPIHGCKPQPIMTCCNSTNSGKDKYSKKPAQKKVFRLEDKKMDWFSAFMDCRSRSMHLASILSKGENEQIKQLVSEINDQELYWLAGTDLAVEGRWRWMASGDSVEFSDWYLTQPDNFNDNEDCLTTGFDLKNGITQYSWHDAECLKLFYFICEYFE